jgi:hypothetical protein
MKKLIATICIWILGKLGYDNRYNPVDTIRISIDSSDAMRAIKKINVELEKMNSLLQGK